MAQIVTSRASWAIYLSFAYWQCFLCVSTLVMNFIDICAENIFIGICTEILELNRRQSLKISYQWSNEINCMNFQLKIQLKLGHQRIFQWFSSEVLSTVRRYELQWWKRRKVWWRDVAELKQFIYKADILYNYFFAYFCRPVSLPKGHLYSWYVVVLEDIACCRISGTRGMVSAWGRVGIS